MDQVIFIELILPEIVPLEGFSEHTALLTGSHQFRTNVVLCFCAPGIKKDASVAGIFNGVLPSNDAWTLEIALELSDLLPSLDGKSESVVSVMTSKHGRREICLSNRMSRFHYHDGEILFHVLLPRKLPSHGHGRVKTKDGEASVAIEERLRTVAAMRFQIKGMSTERAFESSVRDCLGVFFDSINVVLQATRECRGGFIPTTRHIGFDSTPSVYVLLTGASDAQGAVLALSGARVCANPDVLENDQAARFRSIADGAIVLDDIDRLLGEARSSWQNGDYEFAFLQAVIAAEIATARAVHTACRQKGVSETKLKNTRKEMTYSWALNVGIPLVLDSAAQPEPAIINAMNIARGKRNDLMHEGEFHITRAELDQLLTDTRQYITVLKTAITAITRDPATNNLLTTSRTT